MLIVVALCPVRVRGRRLLEMLDTTASSSTVIRHRLEDAVVVVHGHFDVANSHQVVARQGAPEGKEMREIGEDEGRV